MPSQDPKTSTWTVAKLRRAIEAAGVALWSWNIENNDFEMDERAFHLWGLPVSKSVSFEDLSTHIHPADRDRVRAAFDATKAIVGSYELDFRVMIGEEIRWISARGVGNEPAGQDKHLFGVFLDVTGRKQAEEGHELLAGEMSHRVKNLLAIATGLTRITSRSTSTAAEMAHELTGRLTALGRAHDVVRPLAGQQGRAALLGDLITILLSPYEETAAFSERIRVAVPRMGVGEAAATALALTIHELATNSLKYGALSVETGILDISGTADEHLVAITWTERGGPPVWSPGLAEGYGNKLVQRTISGQLGGSIDYDWSLDGLIVEIKLAPARLAA